MRRKSNPAITTQMYRHFATVTVALTALIAFMAGGEKSSAASADSSADHAIVATPAKKRLLKVPEQPTLVDQGSWGSDDDGDFGRPTVSASGGGSWFTNPFGASTAGQPMGGTDLAQRTRDGSDDPADDSASQPAKSAAPTAAQISAAMAASHLRSGSAGDD